MSPKPFTSPPPLFPITSPTSPSPSSSSLPIHLFDGGLGTSLESPPYNFSFQSSTTPLWSSHLLITSELRSKYLVDLHSRFVEAGSDVIGTATYQAGFEGFTKTRKPEGGFFGREEARELMRMGRMVVGEAIDQKSGKKISPRRQKPMCALSLGPLGATLIPGAEYSGTYPEDLCGVTALREWHEERLRVFFDGNDQESEQKQLQNGSKEEVGKGIDVIAFETLGRVDEIVAVREVVGIVNQERDEGQQNLIPSFWISCVFPGEVDGGGKIPDGTGVEGVVEALIGSPSSSRPLPSGIGINCTKLHKLPSLILEFESAITSFLNKQSYRSEKGVFHLILYPDGADNLVYDTVTQQWLPREGAVTSSNQESKSWAERMTEIVADVVQREEERRKKEGRGLWSGLLVGGCCKVEVDMIRELRTKLVGQNLVSE